jgi:hypothetical protein
MIKALATPESTYCHACQAALAGSYAFGRAETEGLVNQTIPASRGWGLRDESGLALLNRRDDLRGRSPII